MRGRDLLMRQDGYVTAAEVAEATGQNLATVHRAIEEGRMPGQRVQTSGRYSGWYVDIHALLKLGIYKPEGAGKTIHDNLTKLATLVAAPKAKPSTKRVAGG